MNLWIHNMMCAIIPLSFVMATSNDGNTVGTTDTSIGDSSFTLEPERRLHFECCCFCVEPLWIPQEHPVPSCLSRCPQVLCQGLVSSTLDPDKIHWRPPRSTKEHCVRKCGIHWKLCELCRIHCPPVSLLFDHRLTTCLQHLKPIGPPRQPFTLMARRRRRGARRRATHAISTSDGAPVVRLYPAISSVLLRNFLENPNCVHCTDSDDIEWTEEVGRRCHWCQRPICFRHSHSRYWWQCQNASSCWKVCEMKQIYSQSQQ